MTTTLALLPRNTAGLRLQIERDSQSLAQLDGAIAAWQAILRQRAGIVPGPVYACCACGREYDHVQWTWLRYRGNQDDGAGTIAPLRNCLCGSTIAPLWASEPEQWAAVECEAVLRGGIYEHLRDAREVDELW